MGEYRSLNASQAEALFRDGAVLLDVRTDVEWQAVRVPGSLHIPLDLLPSRVGELDPDTPVLVLCAHGIRSEAAGLWLAGQGFTSVANVHHGIAAWRGPVERG